jgi:hypothetical protein
MSAVRLEEGVLVCGGFHYYYRLVFLILRVIREGF